MLNFTDYTDRSRRADSYYARVITYSMFRKSTKMFDRENDTITIGRKFIIVIAKSSEYLYILFLNTSGDSSSFHKKGSNFHEI